MITMDVLRFGYGSYDEEFSELIRDGHYDRDEWRELFEKTYDEIKAGVFESETLDFLQRRLEIKLTDQGTLLEA